jgi:hypothetical protein
MGVSSTHAGNAAGSFTAIGSELSIGTGAFTLLCRVKPDTVSYGAADQGTIYSRAFTGGTGGTFNGLELLIYQGNLYVYCGGVANSPTPIAIGTGSWCTVGASRSGSTLTLIKDTTTTTATNSASGSGDGVGFFCNRQGFTSSVHALHGTIQDLALWPLALTVGERAAYHAGVPARRIHPQSMSLDARLIRNSHDSRYQRTWVSGAALAVAPHHRSYG